MTRTLGPVTVRLVEERLFDPPRDVEILSDGRWWPGTQRAWRLCGDGRGWMAEVRWTQQHDWGLGTYTPMVTPDRVRLPGDQSRDGSVDSSEPVDGAGPWPSSS